MAEWNITLNNWSLWLSADEYAWGSYFYAEWIDSYSNSSGFRLWHNIVDTEINKRSGWYPVAMEYLNKLDEEWYNFVWMVWFTSDWYMESDWLNRAASSSDTFWWALYKRPTWSYLNWLIASGELLGITTDKIDRISTTIGLFGTNVVNTPDLTSAGTWSVWAWWTPWATGAVHSTGTNTLRQLLTVTSWKRYRIVTLSTGATTGSCEVRFWTDVLWTITPTSDRWLMGTAVAASASEYVTFIPTNDFNWTIKYVKTQIYDDTKLFPDDITITSAISHPVCVKQWFVYVGSWSLIDIIDTSTWTVYNTVGVIDDDFSIRSITLSWNSIVIWASNWIRSKQYYWNGIDETVSEIIDRSWNNIASVVADETRTYAIISNNFERRAYSVDWYQRTRIANNTYSWRTIEWSNNYYKPNKKYDFLVNKVNQMAIFNDKLYVNSFWWLYVYGWNIIWINSSRSKPIIVDPVTTTIYTLWKALGKLYIWNRKSSVNYISQIYEYNYTPSWYLVTQAITWDNLSSRKALDQFKIWFKNVDSTIGNIKIYAIVDDDYFWTLSVTGVSVTPTAWAIYNVWTNTKAEVISTNISWWAGTILLKTIDNTANYPWNEITPVTKVSWTGDASITVAWSTNMALIRTLVSSKQEYNNDFIFWQDFIDKHMPNWHKIQFVIELNSNNVNVSPEVYEITLSSTIIDA